MPTPTPTGNITSVGETLGLKIAYYAAAKAAGLTESAKMDELATQLCRMVDDDHSTAGLQKVGPWLRDEYGLTGNAAGLVAVAAIKYACPQYAKLVGA